MWEQLSLAGLSGSPDPADGLFFAAFPELNVTAGIARLTRRLRGQHGLKGKVLAADRLHVSLCHVGDYSGLPRDIVATAYEAAATVVMPSFVVAFDRVASFNVRSDGQALVLRGSDGVAGLMVLHTCLGAAMRRAGLRRSVPHYEPHMTLMYGDQCIVEHAVEAIDWTVKEFVLVHSLHGQTRYVLLGRWPLRG
jgi:RNA 2',3'-cyclic 3'-phosphodiesterase